MRAQECRFSDPAIAQTVEHHEVIRLGGKGECVFPLEIFEPCVVRADNVIHVPQLRTDILYHLDAVARVEGPTIETVHRVALAVGVLQLVVELKAANGHDDAFASLDGILCTVVANISVGADDFLGFGVLNQGFVVTAELNLNTQVGTSLVKRVPALVAALRRVAKRAHVHSLCTINPRILAA